MKWDNWLTAVLQNKKIFQSTSGVHVGSGLFFPEPEAHKNPMVVLLCGGSPLAIRNPHLNEQWALLLLLVMNVQTFLPVLHWVIKWLIVDIAFDNSSLSRSRNVFHFFIWNPQSPQHRDLAKRDREKREGGHESTREKTEKLWMEGMESLETVGLYLILVTRQQVSNRGARDGQQRETPLGDSNAQTPLHEGTNICTCYCPDWFSAIKRKRDGKTVCLFEHSRQWLTHWIENTVT